MSNKKKLDKNQTPPPLTNREKLRLEQAKEVKQQERMKHLPKIIAGGAVLLLAIVAVAVSIALGNNQEKERTKVDTPQVAITNLAENEKGIRAFPKVASVPGAPVVEIYEDFQCPACKALEEAYGSMFESLAEEGRIKLQYNSRTFLDGANRNGNKESSTRAAIGAACADNVGKFIEYHDTIFKNQPLEGKGYTDDELAEKFAKQSGIQGDTLKKFQTCYDGQATKKAVQEIDATAAKAGINSTPTIMVNGKPVDIEKFVNSVKNEKDLMKFIDSSK